MVALMRQAGTVTTHAGGRFLVVATPTAGDYKLGLILGVSGSAGRIKAAGKASRQKFMRNLPAREPSLV